MIRAIVIGLCVMGLTMCTQRNTAVPVVSAGHEARPIEEARKWHYQQNEKAIAIIIHGLNLKPSKMEDLAGFFAANNITTLSLSLSGHRGSLEEFKHVTRKTWYHEAASTFQIAREYAEKKRLPLIFTGFSLGALVGCDVMAHSPKQLCDVAILFAPAFTAKWFTRAVLVFEYINKEFVLPSISPRQYRANSGTPVAAYRALFDHINALRDRYESLNLPSLCFIDENDELVDVDTLRHIVDEHHLSKWRVVTLHKDYATATHRYNHLIIDRNSLGVRSWNKVRYELSAFIQLTLFPRQ